MNLLIIIGSIMIFDILALIMLFKSHKIDLMEQGILIYIIILSSIILIIGATLMKITDIIS